MGTIYKNANEVIVWLGVPSGPPSKSTQSWIDIPDPAPSKVPAPQPSKRPQPRSKAPDWKDGNPEIDERQNLTEYHTLEILNPSTDPEQWNSFQRYRFAEICSNVYWTRLWIVQEIMLAKKATIQ